MSTIACLTLRHKKDRVHMDKTGQWHSAIARDCKYVRYMRLTERARGWCASLERQGVGALGGVGYGIIKRARGFEPKRAGNTSVHPHLTYVNDNGNTYTQKPLIKVRKKLVPKMRLFRCARIPSIKSRRFSPFFRHQDRKE